MEPKVPPRVRYLNIDEAAGYLNVTVRFMRRVVAERRVRHYKVGKFVRFDPADLDAFATAHEAGSDDLASLAWSSVRRNWVMCSSAGWTQPQCVSGALTGSAAARPRR
jgi:excisionase family DNA binding protein